jgi:hypothetical protein
MGVATDMAEMQQQAEDLLKRLRESQSEMASLSPQDRKAFLEDMLRNATRTLPPEDKRAMYTATLGMLAPEKSGGAVATAAPSQPAAVSVDDAAAVLAKQWGNLSAEKRKALLATLTGAGVVPAGSGGPSSEKLREAFGLEANDAVDSEQAVAAALACVRTMLTIHRTSFPVWQQRFAGTQEKRGISFPTNLRTLAKGDSGSSQRLDGDLKYFTAMMAAIFNSLGKLANAHASKHLEDFSPEAIRTIVGSGGTFIKSKEASYWAKYEEMMAEVTQDSLARDLRNLFAEIVRKELG